MTAIPGRNDERSHFELYHGADFIFYGEYFSNNQLFIHLDWPTKKFTPSFYKECLMAVKAILDGAKKADIPYVYAMVPKKFVKFTSMFGFSVDSMYTAPGEDEPLFLMKQSTN